MFAKLHPFSHIFKTCNIGKIWTQRREKPSKVIYTYCDSYECDYTQHHKVKDQALWGSFIQIQISPLPCDFSKSTHKFIT